MPEPPEVETTRRGLAPHLEGRRVAGVTLRRPDLRWPTKMGQVDLPQHPTPRQSKRCAKAAPNRMDNAVNIRSRGALSAQADCNVFLRIANSTPHPALRATFSPHSGEKGDIVEN